MNVSRGAREYRVTDFGNGTCHATVEGLAAARKVAVSAVELHGRAISIHTVKTGAMVAWITGEGRWRPVLK